MKIIGLGARAMAGCAAGALVAALSSNAFAQQTPAASSGADEGGAAKIARISDEKGRAPAQQSDVDRVVVTGSFFAGSPTDAALPVQVFSQEELEKQGSPSALEFAKNLTSGGPLLGEANFFGNASRTGTANLNLRSLGSGKTLSLLNGRRTSQNTSFIPQVALSRTEILKDGAAVVYGADATGGVVNFITRSKFEGLQASAQYKYIDGSDGDYGLSLLGGFGVGAGGNFLWSVEWDHRSRLESGKRGFAHQPYAVNPISSASTEIGAWRGLAARPAYPGANGQSGNSFQGEFGAPVGATLWLDYTDASCSAIGGVVQNTGTASAACAAQIAQFYDLVEEQDTYRAFAQFNTSISDDMDFHVEASFAELRVPQISAAGSRGMTQGPARLTGSNSQVYVPRANPYFMDFAARSGLAASSTFAQVQGLTPTGPWRPFIHAGSNYVSGVAGTPTAVDNQAWRVSAGLNGRFGDSFGAFKDVNYDFAVTYNTSNDFYQNPDILSYRLQEAISGFGGPSCNAADLNPLQFGTQNDAAAGKNGCLWFNPFGSSFATTPQSHLTNPTYVSGGENSAELVSWIFDNRPLESIQNELTVDLVFNADTPISLPGGKVGIAAGGQLREIEFRQDPLSKWIDGTYPCVWPSNFTTGVTINGVVVPVIDAPRSQSDPTFTGCTSDGPSAAAFAHNLPFQYNDRQQHSFFSELKIPVLSNLDIQAAVRHEEFSGGLNTTVYKLSGKWNVFGPLSLRGSYGTNYQAPPIDLVPGAQTPTNQNITVARMYKLVTTTTAADVTPETAKSWNFGAIWQSRGLGEDHNFHAIVDYFNIQTDGEIGPLATADQIASAVFNGPAGAAGFNTVKDCSSLLINRVKLVDSTTAPGGQCVNNQTSGQDIESITTVYGNGPGQHTAGIDFDIGYTMPIGSGDLSVTLSGTRLTKLETGATFLDGFQVTAADDRLGYLNFSGLALASPKLRANLSANYAFGPSNLRVGVNYVSAVKDERGAFLVPATTATTDYGLNGRDWVSVDMTYLFDLSDGLRFTAGIANLFDRDPPPARTQLGYDAQLGNPLGRTFEVGLKKKF